MLHVRVRACVWNSMSHTEALLRLLCFSWAMYTCRHIHRQTDAKQMLHLIHSQCNDCKTHESYRVIDKVISAGNKCEEFKKKNASINQCILGISLKHSHSTVTGFIILHGDDSCMGIHTDKTKSHTHTLTQTWSHWGALTSSCAGYRRISTTHRSECAQWRHEYE